MQLRSRRYIVSVIGSGSLDESDPRYFTARELGKGLVDRGYRLLSGGLGGVMEAASRGAHGSDNYREGDVIGILPGDDPGSANRYVDVPIATGLGIGRNMVVTGTDAVIAIGGGSGTLSEMAFAWQRGKLLICLDVKGWSGKMAGERIDDRNRIVENDMAFRARNAEEALNLLDRHINSYHKHSCER